MTLKNYWTKGPMEMIDVTESFWHDELVLIQIRHSQISAKSKYSSPEINI